MNTKYVITAAPAIIVNKKGEILLGKRADNHIFYPSLWGLPGGMIEYKEHISDAVKREVKEEVSVAVVKIKRGKGIYEHFPNKECSFQMIDIPFFCEIKGKPKPKDETSEVKWFKPSEIRKMKLAYTHKEILKGEGLI